MDAEQVKYFVVEQRQDTGDYTVIPCATKDAAIVEYGWAKRLLPNMAVAIIRGVVIEGALE